MAGWRPVRPRPDPHRASSDSPRDHGTVPLSGTSTVRIEGSTRMRSGAPADSGAAPGSASPSAAAARSLLTVRLISVPRSRLISGNVMCEPFLIFTSARTNASLGPARMRTMSRSPYSIRLTAAQALVRYLAAQRSEPAAPHGGAETLAAPRSGAETGEVALFAGVWAVFGHGNVAALG